METSTTPVKPTSDSNKKPNDQLIEKYKLEEKQFTERQLNNNKECCEKFGNGMTQDEFDNLFDG